MGADTDGFLQARAYSFKGEEIVNIVAAEHPAEQPTGAASGLSLLLAGHCNARRERVCGGEGVEEERWEEGRGEG